MDNNGETSGTAALPEEREDEGAIASHQTPDASPAANALSDAAAAGESVEVVSDAADKGQPTQQADASGETLEETVEERDTANEVSIKSPSLNQQAAFSTAGGEISQDAQKKNFSKKTEKESNIKQMERQETEEAPKRAEEAAAEQHQSLPHSPLQKLHQLVEQAEKEVRRATQPQAAQRALRCDLRATLHQIGWPTQTGKNKDIKEQQVEMLRMRQQCRDLKKTIEGKQQEQQQQLLTLIELDKDYLRKKAALDVIARRRRNERVDLGEYVFPLA
ncbi:hypothetical protein ACSSS7_001757 [Eimeria intestinalis]